LRDAKILNRMVSFSWSAIEIEWFVYYAMNEVTVRTTTNCRTPNLHLFSRETPSVQFGKHIIQ
jgi:hypothetical protein